MVFYKFFIICYFLHIDKFMFYDIIQPTGVFMIKTKIDEINDKFEDIKEEVCLGKPLLFAEWEVEELLSETVKLTLLEKNKFVIDQLRILIKQLKQYLYDIQGQIEQETSKLQCTMLDDIKTLNSSVKEDLENEKSL